LVAELAVVISDRSVYPPDAEWFSDTVEGSRLLVEITRLVVIISRAVLYAPVTARLPVAAWVSWS
jgi:hypothetical protein